ncbi:SurA N-terminal domain-containing protein [bacterium]|nr:SurA N-terminal domain-containing protein [bacterium]
MRHNKFFTGFLLTAIIIMITAAFVFWGIGPNDNPTRKIVAEIEGEKITLEAFWKIYDNQVKRLKSQGKTAEEIETMQLQQQVLESLVDRSVLIIAAEEAGISITDEELQQDILKNPYFQKDGVFNKAVYTKSLRLGRTSPSAYEKGLKSDLTVTKISNIIGEAAELSAEEAKLLESIQGDSRAQLSRIFRQTKTNQVLKAFIEGYKKKLDITINRNLIS